MGNTSNSTAWLGGREGPPPGQYEQIWTLAFFLIAAIMWCIGFYGMKSKNKIYAEYNGKVSSGWSFVRMLRGLVNLGMLHNIAGYIAVKADLIGTEWELESWFNSKNIIRLVAIIIFNIFIMYWDKKRLFNCYSRKIAKKIRFKEKAIGFGIITKLSLILSVVGLIAVFLFTDTAEYVEGEDGKIYRIKDDFDL